MSRYSLRHLSDDSLSVALDSLATDDRLANATLLAHIAEFDRRGLCRPTQYPSMYRYCVGHLGMSEDVAYKRVRTAQAARRFPFVFTAIADGRLNPSGVTLLWKHLTAENGRELLEAAMNRSRSEILELIARRFPVSSASTGSAGASAAAEATPTASPGADSERPAIATAAADTLASPPSELPTLVTAGNVQEPQQIQSVPGRIENAGVFAPPAPNSLPELHLRVTPIAPGRYELLAVIDQETHDQLMASKDMLGHAVPSGALVEVLQRAIALQHEHLRKRRCGATGRPRSNAKGGEPRRSANPRRIPAAVRRAVCERDGDRCAFVSDDGHRCEERATIELDHIVPVARGGATTVGNLRQLCSTHNRLVAEREFGKEHMRAKRETAQRRRAAARFHRQAGRARAEKRITEIERQREELGEAFENLGYHGFDLERALGCCATRPDASPEDRIEYALSFMPPRVRKESPPPASAA